MQGFAIWPIKWVQRGMMETVQNFIYVIEAEDSQQARDAITRVMQQFHEHIHHASLYNGWGYLHKEGALVGPLPWLLLHVHVVLETTRQSVVDINGLASMILNGLQNNLPAGAHVGLRIEVSSVIGGL